MDNIKVLFLNQSNASDPFSPERDNVLAYIRSKFSLQESDSIKDAQAQLAEIDILIMWVDLKRSGNWEKLDIFMKEQDISYVGFIIIFGFGGDELLTKVHEALLQKKRTFVCPINLCAIEASINALAEEMKYKKSLENFKSELFKADSLNSIVDKALKQLKTHKLVGYERATISLVDRNTETLARYLLKFDSEPKNNQPKRRLQKDIRPDKILLIFLWQLYLIDSSKRNIATQFTLWFIKFVCIIAGDKLIMRVDKETVFIIQNLEDKRKDKSGRQLADLGWDEDETTTKDIKSWIGLAAKHQNQTVAIITLDYTTEDKYQENNHKLVDFLRDFGEIFANAIIDFFSQRNKRVIKSIFSEMGNHLESKELVRTILTKLKNELGCDNCTYFLVSSDPDSNPDKEEVFLEEWTSAKDDPHKPVEKSNHKFKKGVGIVGTVLESGQSRIVPHAIEDNKFIPSLRHPGDNLSLLAVPVIPIFNENSVETNRIIGVISCYKEKQMDYFTVYDRDLVKDIALSVATVIERTITLEFLNDISSKMAELVLNPDKKQLLEQICQHALKMTSAGSASIHLLEYLDGKYRAIESPQYTYPPGKKELPPRLDGTGTTDLVIVDKEIKEFSEKLGNSDRIRDKGVKSKIVVPLIITKDNQQSLIGALYLNKYSEEPFSKVEKFALELFAKQAASIINDQNTLSEKQFRADAHQKFSSAIAEIADKDDIGLLLRDVARYSCELSKAKFSFVDMYNHEDKPEVKAAWPEYRLIDVKNKSCEDDKIGIIGLAKKDKKPYRIDDINEEKKKNSEKWQQYIEYDKETISELAVPIIDQKNHKVIGMINLEHSKPYAFTRLHQEVIEHFAAQVAIAYQKKKLIDFINNNNGMLTSLHQSLPNIMSETPQNMLYKAVSATRELLEADEVIVIPFKDKKNLLLNQNPIVLKDEIVPQKADNIIQILEETSQKVYCDRKDNQLKNFYFGGLKISYGLCLPFSAGLKKIGVMWILFSKSIDVLQLEKNKDVYKAYANQIALAYENAKRFEELKNKEAEDLSKEIKTYSNDVRNEAKTWFLASLISASLGFVFICFGVYLLYIGVNANPYLVNDSKNTINTELTIDNKKPATGENLLNHLNKGGIASTIAGIILEAVTVLFFKSMKESNKRLDRYHEERVDIGKLSILLAATGQIAPDMILAEKQKIIQLTANKWLKSTNEVKNTDKVDEFNNTGR
ncbi:hypothetical protein NIES2100_63460 [Calothrix sp. NIES-2100]|uniref:GAF domain-containing protein n=1 Tax=Calothrix sp. NIES-2100 TaxID=1954172 RepID=UPI000B6168D4|nr:hypothetical protein NIES2100_63460 [Calothrix sp. NIES-2100]